MSWKLNHADSLPAAHHQEIEPFWQQYVTEQRLVTPDGMTLAYATCEVESPRANIVISSGRIESLLKYKELVYELWHNNFSVFIVDHRGQGQSGRMHENPNFGYVASFDDYVADLAYFVEQCVPNNDEVARHLLCHSMGSAVGALALLAHPQMFDKAVFCSPMFGVRPAMPSWMAELLITLGLRYNRLRNRDVGYFFGQTPYVAYPFAINPLTHCEARYQIFRDLYEAIPELQVGGVTSEWLRAAQDAMNTIERDAPNIQVPILAFTAGSDKIIDNKRQVLVIQRLANVEHHVIEGAYHELFSEIDEYRNPTLAQIFDFFVK